VIEVSELTKYYGERKGVGPLSFSIESGEIIGLLGLNGAGKTTTLRMLSSDLLPTSGKIVIDGVDLIEDPERVRGRIGYLPELPPLYEEMRVREYLRFAARLRGVPANQVDQRVDAAIDQVELGGEADTRISALSHGYRQRVGIAQAVVHRPALLLLDEPTSGLDPVQIVEMRELVRSLRGEHTIVISSHNLPEISETCDRLLIIRAGEIIAQGSEEQLASRVSAGFMAEVTVRVPEAIATHPDEPEDGVREIIAAVESVRDVSRIESEEPGDDVATFRVLSSADVRVELCRALVSHEVGILGLSPHELEDVFLQLTGDDSSDAEPGDQAGRKRSGEEA
jgi:ABC-2 type transport system ATP-binding protein